ncbi:signal peptide-containing protein [Cryptosporidium canis]|uniref:Signal peptide-containing protein n=1 Tax=Cryptosporidium canis TaxID=195482 RepID=A0A9D5HV60_9CRYT|nr:signal peptide-containing protein [Cryptosporidium canis]
MVSLHLLIHPGDGTGSSASRSSRSSPKDGADGHSNYGGSRRDPYSQSSPPGGYDHYHSGHGIRSIHSASGSPPLYSVNFNFPASGAGSASGKSHAGATGSVYSGGYGDKTRPQAPFTVTYVTPYSTLLGTGSIGGQPGYGSRGSALRRRGRFESGPEPISVAPQTKGAAGQDRQSTGPTSRGESAGQDGSPGGRGASTPLRSRVYDENDELLTIYSGDYHNSRSVGEEILTQATTAHSTIYRSLSLCKSKLLRFDPTSKMALSVYKGLHLREESLPKSEKKLKVSNLLQYGDMVSSISHITAESTKNLSLSSKIEALTFMDQLFFEFSAFAGIHSFQSLTQRPELWL